MKVLCPGHESEKRVGLLLRLTSVSSPEKRAAIEMHLCGGKALQHAADLCSTDAKNLAKALATVEAVAAIVEEIKVEDGVTKLTPERRRSILELEAKVEFLTGQLEDKNNA
jgi:hypothetical protein